MRQSDLQKILAVQEKLADNPDLRPAYTIDGFLRERTARGCVWCGSRKAHSVVGRQQRISVRAERTEYARRCRLKRLLQMTTALYPDPSMKKDAPAEFAPTGVFRTNAFCGALGRRARLRHLPIFVRLHPGELRSRPGRARKERKYASFLARSAFAPDHRAIGTVEVSNTMRTYWTNFAKYGDPNGPDVPMWRPQFARGTTCSVISNAGITCGPDPDEGAVWI